ncbi:MAG: hypothetical protein JNG82_07740 [Opitutaceae bacterium]|nr:hypothetical protein [Opitutaceae bacterium]
MSLINDALKKAQKQRTGEAPALGSLPSVGGESARSISRRSKSSGPNPLLIGGIAAAVVVIGGGTWFALSDKPAVSPQPSALSSQPAPSPLASSPSPVAKPRDESAVGPAKADTFTLQTAPKTEDRRPTSAASSAPGGPVSAPAVPSAVQTPTAKQPEAPRQAPIASSPTPPPAAPVRPLDARAIEYLDNIKVAGIRASATDAKVLMNDRVYRVGSVVNGEMGLRLVGITANTLTFEDPAGGRYTRTF